MSKSIIKYMELIKLKETKEYFEVIEIFKIAQKKWRYVPPWVKIYTQEYGITEDFL